MAKRRDESEWQREFQAAREGSEKAIARLVEMLRPFLLALANEQLPPAVRPKEAASDVVQETIVKAQREFGKFEGSSPQEFMAWLRAILVHELIDCRRHWSATSAASSGSGRSARGTARATGTPTCRPARRRRTWPCCASKK